MAGSIVTPSLSASLCPSAFAPDRTLGIVYPWSRAGLAVFLLFLVTTACCAQQASSPKVGSDVQVQMRGGKLLRGKLVSQDSDSVVVSGTAGVLKLPRDRVLSVQPFSSVSSTTGTVTFEAAGRPTFVDQSGTSSFQAKAQNLAKTGQLGSALRVASEELAPESPGAAWRLAATLPRIHRSVPLSNRTDLSPEAIALETAFALAAAERFAPLADPQQFAALCTELGDWLTDLRRPDELKSLARILDPVDANAAARLHHLVEFQSRIAAVTPGNYLAAYRLGKWASERGLDRQTRDLMTLCSGHPDLGPNARLHLELLDRKAARDELRSIREVALHGNPDELKRAVTSFQSRFPDSAYETHLFSIQELHRLGQGRAAGNRSFSAAASLQDLERLTRMGDHSGALIAAQKIRAEAPGTEAARIAEGHELRARQALGQVNPDIPERPGVFGPRGATPPPTTPTPAPQPEDPETRRMREIDAMARQASWEANRPRNKP